MPRVSALELLRSPEAFRNLGPERKPKEPDHADLMGELIEQFPSFPRRTHRGERTCR